MNNSENPFRVLIVGAGPAGFFTLDAIIKLAEKNNLQLQVDMLNRDVRPGGLAVYGVAPDHTKIRSIKDQFEEQLEDPRVHYYGNVCFGTDISVTDIVSQYHVVIYSVGAQSDQKLGIPGEDLKGCYSGREFTSWYNGDPLFADLAPNLKTRKAIIIGAGNVAADIARVLVRPISELEQTDISSHALDFIRESSIEEVDICVRRSPVHVKFTPAEVRALSDISGVSVVVDPEDLVLAPELQAMLEEDREAAKNYSILSDIAKKPFVPGNKIIRFRFYTSPLAMHGSASRLQSVTLQRNTFSSGRFVSVPGSEFAVDSGLLVKSVGYKVIPIPGLPYDENRAVIYNQGGRLSEAGIPRQYVVGWAADGASGIIGTNKIRARKVVNAVAEDLAAHVFHLEPVNLEFSLRDFLLSRKVRFVDFDDWKKLDAFECHQGHKIGRPRVKLLCQEEMLKALEDLRNQL